MSANRETAAVALSHQEDVAFILLSTYVAMHMTRRRKPRCSEMRSAAYSTASISLGKLLRTTASTQRRGH